jgi:hypothetical protein
MDEGANTVYCDDYAAFLSDVDGKNEIKTILRHRQTFRAWPCLRTTRSQQVIMEVLGPTGTQMERSHTWSRD